MHKTLILGRGPSLSALEHLDTQNITNVILMNNHEKTLQKPAVLDMLKDKDVYVMCNVNQSGFVPGVLDKINIKSCLTNRFYPDWELWQTHKDKQRRHNEGGTLNNLSYLPYIAEDEPYLYTWRGPKGRNKKVMKTYDGRIIEHMPEQAEQYIIPVYENGLIGNCSYYGTLYAIIKLKAQHIVYCGVDFYDAIKINKKWYIDPPKYLDNEWRSLRLKYEGEHMKVLWDDYIAFFFPSVCLEFHTTAEINFKSQNIKYHKIDPKKDNKIYF
jgi:hypothetical protein